MTKQFKAVCPKCGGQGTFGNYKHIDNGICYRCKGTGEVLVSEKTYKKQQEQLSKGPNVRIMIIPSSRSTYKDKAAIKELGFKFDREYGWIIWKWCDELDEQVKSELAALGNAARAKGMDGIFTSDQAAFADLAQTPQEMQQLIIKMMDQPELITHFEGYKF